MFRLIIFGVAFYFVLHSPFLRILLKNIPYVLFYVPIDLFLYIRRKSWRNLKTGKIHCYCSPEFGGGKTLSAVEYVESMYNAYNDRVIYDFARKKFVVQKVEVYSNVVFKNIPYIQLNNLSALCNCASLNRLKDEAAGTLTCSLFLIDEAGSELNSRSFKDNLNPLVLKELVTCRHNHISVILTSQDFSLIDALMRKVTSSVIYAMKTWRVCVHRFYDPKELENAGSYLLIKPVRSGGFFVRNKNYAAYDTYAVVDKLNKRFEENDLLSEEEILANLALAPADSSTIMNPSKRFLRSRKLFNKRTGKK